MFHFSKIKKLINNQKRIFDLKFILFLNFTNFILELLSILSVPIFASILIDKNYLIDKFKIELPVYLINYDLILIASFLVVSLFLLKNIFYIFLIYKQSDFIKKIKTDVSEKVFNQYLFGSYNQHLERNPSTITRDATYTVQSFGFYLFHLINLFRESTSVLFIILLILFVKPIIVISSGILLVSITYVFLKKLKKPLSMKARENQELNKLFTKEVHDTFLSIKDVKILRKESDVLKNFKDKIKKYENNLYFFQILEKLPRTILEVFSIIFILILSFVLISITDDKVELFTLLSLFVVATIRLLPSFTSINTSLNYLKIFEPSILTLFELNKSLDNFRIIKKDFKERNNSFDKSKNIIVVENLFFGYSDSQLNLKNLNLEINKEKMNCIIGKTGSGKSTLFNIMLGLLEPNSGNVFFNNENIKKDIAKWYSSISLVSQDPYLFEDTIKKNITFNIANETINEQRLKESIDITVLNDTISKLPDGLNTQINTQGINLSGGEKQRIALARAIYKNSEILFLDEFTNAIDDTTEVKIMQNLKKLKNKTFIIISHKKNTINQCDKIWKLEQGSINLMSEK